MNCEQFREFGQRYADGNDSLKGAVNILKGAAYVVQGAKVTVHGYRGRVGIPLKQGNRIEMRRDK